MEPIGLKSGGVDKYTFVANHKFGLVGVKVSFDELISGLALIVFTKEKNETEGLEMKCR